MLIELIMFASELFSLCNQVFLGNESTQMHQCQVNFNDKQYNVAFLQLSNIHILPVQTIFFTFTY